MGTIKFGTIYKVRITNSDSKFKSGDYIIFKELKNMFVILNKDEYPLYSYGTIGKLLNFLQESETELSHMATDEIVSFREKKEIIPGTDLFFDTQYKITDFEEDVVNKHADLHLEIGDTLYVTKNTKNNGGYYKIWNGMTDIYEFALIQNLRLTLGLFELQENNPQPCNDVESTKMFEVLRNQSEIKLEDINPSNELKEEYFENDEFLLKDGSEFPDETECEDKSSEKDKDNLVDAPVFVPEVKINIGRYNDISLLTVRYFVKGVGVDSKELYEFKTSHIKSNTIPRMGETIKFEVITEKQPRPNCKRDFDKIIKKATITEIIWDLSGGGVSIEAKF